MATNDPTQATNATDSVGAGCEKSSEIRRPHGPRPADLIRRRSPTTGTTSRRSATCWRRSTIRTAPPGPPEATAALTTLFAEPLPAPVTREVHHALNLTTGPSGDSAQALLAEVDDPAHGDTALLAAANQARTLDGDDPEATRDVVELLLKRYTEATSNPARGLLVGAMGNTGAPRVLPALQHALQTGDVAIARYAAFALRHIPGGEADGLLELLLRQHASEAVRIQAMRAIEVRGPALWAERVEAWLPGFAAMPHLQAAAREVLDRWVGPPPSLAMAEQR